MESITINYKLSDIRVGAGLLSTITVPHRKVALVFDAALEQLHWPVLQRSLATGRTEVTSIKLPAGEASKNFSVFASVLSQLAQAGLTRDSAVVALGGGATSDLAGYVAASYLRGIDFYVVPTTLLAMVDASIGGKTGINLPEGKNLVGAFWQPKAVWADVKTLSTLPLAVLREGMAEAFKHGLIRRPELLEIILGQAWHGQSQGLGALVALAVAVKAEIVSNDPHEHGERAFLNYGHTLAHALEAITNHALPHGEAVGYGMHYAAHLGKQLGMVDVTHLTKAFLRHQQPLPLPALVFEDLAVFMGRDKKSNSGGLRFVLLGELAKPVLLRVEASEQLAAWHSFVADC
jgi:3-dehydroquinate synthase